MNCTVCDGQGWYAAGETDKPEQVQCPDCLGTGVASEADSVREPQRSPLRPLLSQTSAVAPSVVAGVEEKRWGAYPISNDRAYIFQKNSTETILSEPMPTAQAVKLTSAHNASLGEPREKEDLGLKEPSSARTHVLQKSLQALLARKLTLAGIMSHREDWRRELEDLERTINRVAYVPMGSEWCAKTFGRRSELETLLLVMDLWEADSVGASNAVLPPPVSENWTGIPDSEVCHCGELISKHDQLQGCNNPRPLSSPVSESPVGSTATGVSDEDVTTEATDDITKLLNAGLTPFEQVTMWQIVLTAIRKSKSLSEPKELEEKKSLGEPGAI